MGNGSPVPGAERAWFRGIFSTNHRGVDGMIRLFGGRHRKSLIDNKDAPIAETRYVVVDTELTGLNKRKDAIVSVGAVRMTGGRIDLGSAFSRLVSPRTALTAESVVIHEITPSEVAAEPAIGAVLAEFLDFCGNDVLVGYCVSIDLAFITRELKRLRREPLPNAAVDTAVVIEWLRKRMKSHRCLAVRQEFTKLYDLARCFGITVNGAHKALMDAYITAQLFQRMLPLLQQLGIETVGELVKIGDPYKGGDRFRQSGEISNL